MYLSKGGRITLIKNILSNNVDVLANILECTLFSLPMKYLSLPLRAPFKFKSIWDGIIEKIERRLIGWRMMYLSKVEGLP
jgi:hypothetical protein